MIHKGGHVWYGGFQWKIGSSRDSVRRTIWRLTRHESDHEYQRRIGQENCCGKRIYFSDISENKLKELLLKDL